MKRFKLIRWSDKSGVSDVGHVASGVEFDDGACALRWKTRIRSTAFYDNWHDLIAIHGHGIKTVCHWVDDPPQLWLRGYHDCLRDHDNNTPFACVGGMEAGPNEFKTPEHFLDFGEHTYLHGYICRAIELFGLHWATDKFTWAPHSTAEPREGVEVP